MEPLNENEQQKACAAAIMGLHNFACAEGAEDEKVWVTRAEARAITDLLWHLIEKGRAKEEGDD